MGDQEPKEGTPQADEDLEIKLLLLLYLICVPVFPDTLNLTVVICNVSLSRQNIVIQMFFLSKALTIPS